MIRQFITLSLWASIVLICSCKKDKVNAYLQTSGTETNTNSSIRLFNFYNFNLDMTINNIPLTTYSAPLTQGTAIGLSLFPKGYWATSTNGNPFFVPSSLVTKNRQVHVQISAVPGQLTLGVRGASTSSIDTTLTDDPLNPSDYYVLATGHLLVIPRNTEAPILPDHFKIRVINLGAAMDPNNLTGPARLTYADGSSIDPALDNVPAGSISVYVDLPYGPYMFKLFSNGDFSRQFTELPTLPNMDICDYPGNFPVPQQGIFPQLRTFKPGATYSVVVTQNMQIFPACNPYTAPQSIFYNGYRIITEQSPGANVTYARMDAVNALPVETVSISVDGQQLGNPLPFTAHTDYSTYVVGGHQVQVKDGNGNVLVTKSITLAAYDDFTAWVYENPSGSPDICFANTDATSSLYQTDENGNVFTEYSQPGNTVTAPPVDDGTNGSIRVLSIPYAWQTRFLNLTPDLPYATFTNNASLFTGTSFNEGSVTNTVGNGDSLSFASASENLAPGLTPLYDPFVITSFLPTFSTYGGASYGYAASGAGTTMPPGIIRVFQSSPGPPAVAPGAVLPGIAPLKGSSYIANPAIYSNSLYMPVTEDGVYTTALVGRVFTASSQSDAAQLIILKHNK